MSILSNLTAEQFQSILLDEMTLLHHAAFDGNTEVLKMMRNLPYYKEVVDSDNNEIGWTPVLWATARGELEALEELVKSGAQILKPRKDGVTTLHLAACTNDVHVLNYILKAKSTSSVDMISDDVLNIFFKCFHLGLVTGSSCSKQWLF